MALKREVHTCELLSHQRIPSASLVFSFVALPSFSAQIFPVVLLSYHVYAS